MIPKGTCQADGKKGRWYDPKMQVKHNFCKSNHKNQQRKETKQTIYFHPKKPRGSFEKLPLDPAKLFTRTAVTY
jgi:hypothetical protein